MVQYYLAVAPGALGGARGRPMALKRFVNGAENEAFFQKRAPAKRPDWIETVELRFPSGRTADEVVVTDEAGLAWVVNLGCIDLNPHPVRATNLDHPDELRVDLDPVPGVEWPQIRDVAMAAAGVLADFGLTGWPKTSGSRGIHVYARIVPHWSFGEVRRAAVAVAREIERRAPDLATSKWWKEERHGVFVDYNQNAKDRTVASAYSIRPTSDARVSTPLTWPEVPDCQPEAFTIDTVPARFADMGDVCRGSTRPRARWRPCSGWLVSRRRRGRPTRRGRRISPSRMARLPVSSPQNGGPPARRCRIPRRARRAARPGAVRAACRSSRWPVPPVRRRPWPDSTGGRSGTRMSGLCWRPPTCWWTRCEDAVRPGPGSG